MFPKLIPQVYHQKDTNPKLILSINRLITIVEKNQISQKFTTEDFMEIVTPRFGGRKKMSQKPNHSIHLNRLKMERLFSYHMLLIVNPNEEVLIIL